MAETIQTPSSATSPKRQREYLDARWLLLFIIILSVLITTAILNNNLSDEAANQLASSVDVDNGDTKINWNRYSTTDIELSEASTTITQSGTYHITGSLADGTITIDAGTGVVRLILDNANIANSSGPAIICTAADDLVIELVGENSLKDATTYATTYDEDVTGAIYSKADLTFQGDGTLNLIANYQDGIVGKDDVKFIGGTYYIDAADDGIRGKDSVYVTTGNFHITATADAIKSTNETTLGKGFILIENGNFNLTASAKGIKAPNKILIQGGNFIINSYDDAIHSNSYLSINNGTFNIRSGDDGIHADRELIINDGSITIAKSYEGLEAQTITINGGLVSLSASDDGINAGGGTDNSSTNRVGGGPFDADENCIIAINGGNIYVDSAGDGIDSNGWLYFNGGNVLVYGPTNNGNGALDAGMGIVMNGGTVFATGSSGMAETLGSASSIYNVSVYFDSTLSDITTIEIKDQSNQTIFAHTTSKSFSHLAAGSPEFRLGESYTIYLNGEKYQSFTISNITTTIGRNTTNQQMLPSSNRR